MSKLFKHLRINESYITEGTVVGWNEKLAENSVFYEVRKYDDKNVSIKRIKGPTDKKSKNIELFNLMSNWDGKSIIIDGPVITARMYVCRYNKEFNDVFRTRQTGTNKVEIFKTKESVVIKKTLSINEYKFVRNELISEIFDLQRKMFGFVTESECALSLIDELDILSKPIHMRELLLKHENNRIKKILNRNESIESDVDDVVIVEHVNDESPVREVIISDQSDDDDDEQFDWESEIED